MISCIALALAPAGCRRCLGRGLYQSAVCPCVLRRVCRSVLQKYHQVAEIVSLGPPVVARRTRYGLTYSIPDAEFCADVLRLAWDTLIPRERQIFEQHFLGRRPWYDCRPMLERGVFFHAVYRIERRLGRTFLAAGLYPVEEYFTTASPVKSLRAAA